MAIEFSEPGKLVLSVLDQLIDRIKSARPLRTNGKPLTNGIVYSQLVLGMPCDPVDYVAPWSPAGGGTVQDAIRNAPAIAAPPADPAAPAGAAPATAPGIDPKIQRALNAAWKTSRLVDVMLMVTDDDSYLEYPTARHVSFAYEGIINGMQPLPMPPVSADVQKQIDEANKVLFELDTDGSIIGRTKLYQNYLANAMAYAQAKADFTAAQAKALADPVTAGSWPLMSAPHKRKVDDAFDAFKTQGAEKVERALDILESVGISMQAHMIAKARKNFDQWSLAGLSGVADDTPYSYVSPTNWADPMANDVGWQRLQVSHSEYNSHSEFHSSNFAEGHYHRDTSSNTGGGGASFLGFGAYGQGGNSSLNVTNTFQSQNGNSYQFHNDAKNLNIDLEYALCTINRPWFMGDLFYLRDWYLVGNKKNAISDGTLTGMVNDSKHLMPMIPTQFLAIRNVKISAKREDWGGDGQTLTKMYQDSQTQGSSWSAGGGGGFSCGLFTIGGYGSHSESHADSKFNSRSSTDSSNNYGWSFDGEVLEIRGTQIIAFLNQVLPATAPADAPATAPADAPVDVVHA